MKKPISIWSFYGDWELRQKFQIAKDAGFDGWVAAEMIPPLPFYKYAPETLIDNTSRAMDKIFAM